MTEPTYVHNNICRQISPSIERHTGFSKKSEVHQAYKISTEDILFKSQCTPPPKQQKSPSGGFLARKELSKQNCGNLHVYISATMTLQLCLSMLSVDQKHLCQCRIDVRCLRQLVKEITKKNIRPGQCWKGRMGSCPRKAPLA